MSLATLTGIPLQFEAGTTLLFTEQFTDFPNTAWTATLAIEQGVKPPITVAATNSNADFLFTLERLTTAGVPPGDYDYAIYCYTTSTKLQRATAKTGTVTVLPDLTQSLTPSFAESQVTLLQGALATLASSTSQSVSFNGQSFSRAQIQTYQQQLVFWEARVIAEQAKLAAQRGAPDPGRIQTQFYPVYGPPFVWQPPWNQ